MSLSLTLPIVASTPGTDAADMINTALTAVQNTFNAHAHTGGDGAKIKPAGIEIDSSLSFIDSLLIQHGTTGMKFCGFSSQASAPSFGHGLFVLNDDLYYNNGTINLAITSGGAPLPQPNGLTDIYDTNTLGSGKLGYLGSNVYKFTEGDGATAAASTTLSGIQASNINSVPGGNLEFTVPDGQFLLDVAAVGGTATLGSAGTMTVKSDADVVVTSGTEMGLTTTAGHLTLTSTQSTSNIALVGGAGAGNGCTFSGGSSSMSIFRNIDITATSNLTGGGRGVAFVANNGEAKLETTRGATLIKAAHSSAGAGTVTLESNADVILEPGAPITANYCTTTPNTILITDNETDPGELETVDVGHRNRQNCISARATFDVVPITDPSPSVTPRANRWNVASADYTDPVTPVAGEYTITLNEAIPSDASLVLTSNNASLTVPAYVAVLNVGLTTIDVKFSADVTAFSLVVVGA